MGVGSQLQEFPWVEFETGSHMRKARRDWRKADHYRQVGGRYDMQGNSHTRLVLGNLKGSKSLHLPPESCLHRVLTRFSHRHTSSSGDLNSTCSLKPHPENDSGCGKGGQAVPSRGRGGGKSLWLPRSSWGLWGQSTLAKMDCSDSLAPCFVNND